MKRLSRLILLAFLAGGWAVAAAALQVVRTSGPIPYVGGVTIMPKEQLTYRQTYIDATDWTADDFAAHPRLAERMKTSARTLVIVDGSSSCCMVKQEAPEETAALQEDTASPGDEPTDR